MPKSSSILRNNLSFLVIFLSLFFLFYSLFIYKGSENKKNEFGFCTKFIKGIKAYEGLKTANDKLFNDPVTGSCSLIINPKQKVFIDTRFDFYGDEFSKDVTNLCNLNTREINLKEFLNRWKINTFLISKDLPIFAYLNDNPNFIKNYEDNAIGIFKTSDKYTQESQ